MNKHHTLQAEPLHDPFKCSSLATLHPARPLLGRLFTREEHQAETSRVVLLSHRFWRERLRGQPDRIGTLLQVNGQPFTIIGVLPNSFDIPSGVDLWLPIGHAEG